MKVRPGAAPGPVADLVDGPVHLPHVVVTAPLLGGRAGAVGGAAPGGLVGGVAPLEPTVPVGPVTAVAAWGGRGGGVGRGAGPAAVPDLTAAAPRAPAVSPDHAFGVVAPAAGALPD